MSKNYELNVNIHVYIHDDHADESTQSANHQLIRQDVMKAIKEALASAERTKSYKTSANYATALRSLLNFLGSEEKLQTLSPEVIEAYQHWLRERGLCLNTISCYMRSLRSLLKSIIPVSNQFFSDVFTGNTKTEKRAITEADILALLRLELPHGTPLALARDLFLFSFYAQGMPFVDMAHLTKSQIANDRITYYRRKTGQRINIGLEPCMKDIIQRYQRPGDDHVFPLLTHEGDYNLQLNRYNRLLKQLAQIAKIEKNLTSYVARHSWASIAYKSSVDLAVISKALGHTNPQTTMIYVKELNDERLEQANHELLKNFQ